jgi:hypothetical protein
MAKQTSIRTRSDSVTEWALVLAVTIIATGLSQPLVLDLPFRHLLLTEILTDVSNGSDKAQQMAIFFLLVQLPWSMKVLFWLVLDTVPLWGTRRRNYLLVGVLLASMAWLVISILPYSYSLLVANCFVINALLVLVSTAGGALFVEVGQRLRAVDRLAAARIFGENVIVIASGPLAGWLAMAPLALFSIVGGAIPLALVPIVGLLLREPRTETFEISAVDDAWRNLKTVLTSVRVWAAAALLFALSGAHSFHSVLYIHQTTILHFANYTIGWLNGISGLGGIIASFIYASSRHFWELKTWLRLAIIVTSLNSACYLFYSSIQAAYAIHFFHGFFLALSFTAMLEVAGLATPQNISALGFALMASAWNFGASIGDNLSAGIEILGFGFMDVMVIYAALTPLALLALQLLPSDIIRHK